MKYLLLSTGISARTLLCYVALASVTMASYAKDLPGSQDHPLLSRYPGSQITYYDQNELADYLMSLSPPQRLSSREYRSTKHEILRGKLTRLVYLTREGSSELQVFENYRNALSQPGFTVVHQCTGVACGTTAKNYRRAMAQSGASFHDKAAAYYIAARYERVGRNPVYLVVLVGGTNRRGRPRVVVNVIETKALELGKVTSNADALLDSLMQTGRAQIYDVYFDTGKATIKPESANALAAIQEVLQRQPKMRLYVVGHTDDTGSLVVNDRLSSDRASAVVSALVTSNEIAKERLYARGVGPFAPVASNDHDTGRAKNRRVELVRRLP